MRGNEAKANDDKYQTIRKELDVCQQAFLDTQAKHKSVKKDYEELLERWMAKVEEDAKTMNLANEIYSDMVSLKKKDQMIREGQIEASQIDISRMRSVNVSPVPATATKNFVSEIPFLFLRKLN